MNISAWGRKNLSSIADESSPASSCRIVAPRARTILGKVTTAKLKIKSGPIPIVRGTSNSGKTQIDRATVNSGHTYRTRETISSGRIRRPRGMPSSGQIFTALVKVISRT